MTEEKRPVGRPEKEIDPDELMRLIEEYVSKLENIENKGQAYRYISSELDTEHNRKIAEEYYKKFKIAINYRKLWSYNSAKNKPRTLFSIVTKLCKFKDLQANEESKVYRYCIYPGLIHNSIEN